MNTNTLPNPECKNGFKPRTDGDVERLLRPSDNGTTTVQEATKATEQGPHHLKRLVGTILRNRVFQVLTAIVTVIAVAVFIRGALIHETTDDAYTTSHVHTLASRVTGTVLKVLVDDNQKVHAGDILVVLDPTDFQVQVDQARANYETAQANLKRSEALRSQGAVSQQDYDTYTSACEVAKAKLQDAEDQLAYTVIRAPSDGRIGSKTVETGNRINAGSALMAVVDDVWVVANFKETQLGDIRPGQPAEIQVDAIPGKTFRGTVDSWSPGSGATFALLPPDNATGNFTKIVQRVPVKIRFDADSIRGYENRIVPGLSCEASVLLHGGVPNQSTPLHPETESIPVMTSR